MACGCKKKVAVKTPETIKTPTPTQKTDNVLVQKIREKLMNIGK